MRVLIDAGHGIDTPGKRSPDGAFLEYLWNREVAEMTSDLLEEYGFDVDLVVTETNDVPLKTRVRRINEVCSLIGSHNVLLLSIHSNAAGNGKDWMNAKGWSAYTCKGSTRSDVAAKCLYDAFEEEFKDRTIRRDMSDGDPDWEEDFYIIKKTSCPVVLLENFFYDNKEECAFLMTDQAKRRIARAIVSGIQYYYGNKYY
jgi:N-acetylmuramoyl-L-alanine amidase